MGKAGNECDWDRVVEAMLIQLDQDDGSRGYKGKDSVSYASGSRSSWSFPVETRRGSFAYDAEADDESQWNDAQPKSP